MAVSAALTAYRRTRVVELVASGASFDEAAVELGYANRSGPWKAFYAALSAREAESVDTHRVIDLDRLDALQAAMWDRATAGDVKAAAIVLRVMEQRCRLLGLDQGQPDGAGGRPLVDPAY